MYFVLFWKMRHFWIFLVIYWQLQSILAWRSFIFALNDVECSKQSSNIISHLNCSIVKFKRRGTLQMSLRFAREIVRPSLDFDVVTERKNQPDFTIVNVTNIDGCEFLELKGFTLLKIIRNAFEKFSNLPNHCPVPQNTEIHVKNLIISEDSFPLYMPETKFHVHVRLWEHKQIAFELSVHGNFSSKKKSLY